MDELHQRISKLEDIVKIHQEDLKLLVSIIKSNDECSKIRHQGLIDIIFSKK